ncbi:MAG: molecular chaperone DnaK, partial [Deltaproteobacteria bacterium]|nr:molecular chaperone DnaK [Deltaproteobacteria bacterium]
QDEIRTRLGKKTAAPDLILFNGGALKPKIIRERIRQAIRHGFEISDDQSPRVLDNPDPDLAVALGAGYYGLVKTGIGVRVGSGSARAYYLGVSSGVDGNTPSAQKEAICLVERGLDEGSNIELVDKKFEVLTNQPVRFDVYSSSYRSGDRCGNVIPVDDSFTRLPPLQTVIEFGSKGVQSRIPIAIEARFTEMGTLNLWCCSLPTHHRWQLQFQLRDADEASAVGDETVLENSVVTAVQKIIQNTFSGPADPHAISSLVKTISKTTGLKKEGWPLRFIRQITDDLIELAPARQRTPDMESRWLNLTGFCLRPGLGDGFDPNRIKRLWKLYRPGPLHANNSQVRSEWWVLWRRIGGGMSPGHQRQLSQDLTPVMMPKKEGKRKITLQEQTEIWMLIANLEQLQTKDKIRWGKQLLSEIKPKKSKPQLLWSLSRLGAREMLYGAADRVIPPAEAYDWCECLINMPWRKIQPVGAAVAQLARKTGDRVRDLSPEQLDRIHQWFSQFDELSRYSQWVTEVVPMAAQEERAVFGESLPNGLLIHLS